MLAYIYYILAKRPSAARGKKFEKINKNFEKKFGIFLAYTPLLATKECPQKCQPNRSSCFAGYRQHIYIQMSCFIIKIVHNILYNLQM